MSILATASRPAVDDFLAAVRHRAERFAALCGDADGAALRAATTVFLRRAAGADPAQWPRLWWRSLLSQLPASPPPIATALTRRLPLLAALARVPSAAARVLLLRVWIGLPLAECADACGESESITAARLVLALQQMRAQLGGAEDDRWLGELREGLDRLPRPAPAPAGAAAAVPAPARSLRAPRRGLTAAACATALLVVVAAWGWREPAPFGGAELAPAAAAQVITDPLAQLLSLPAEDFALLAAPIELVDLAELELHRWAERAADAR